MFFLLVLLGSLVALSCVVLLACDFCHTPLAFAFTNILAPLTSNLMVPSHDVLLACGSW